MKDMSEMLMGLNVQNEITSIMKKSITTEVWWINTLVMIVGTTIIMKLVQDPSIVINLSRDIGRRIYSLCYQQPHLELNYELIIPQTTNQRGKSDFYTSFLKANDNLIAQRAILFFLKTNGALKSNQHNTLYMCCQWDTCDNDRESILSREMLLLPNEFITYNNIQIEFSIVKEKQEDSSSDSIRDGKPKEKETLGLHVKLQANTPEECQAFVDNALTFYLEKWYPKTEDDVGASFFDMVKPSPTAKKITFRETPHYKPQKTFQSLFFSEKEHVMKVISDFTQRKHGFNEKFERGWKLGIFLYGPPGTGKSSFIKSIARMTNRNVFNIPMPYVRTATNLIELFRAETIKTQNLAKNNLYCRDDDDDYAHMNKIPFDKRIYVFEDVDTESKLFNKRKAFMKKGAKEPSDSNESEDTLIDQALKIRNLLKEEEKDKTPEYMQPAAHFINEDPLTLGTFLNCMDGLVETHGLIYIFTTNCIDEFDPAFLREGRIHLRIHMSYCTAQDIVDIINYNFKLIAEINASEDRTPTSFSLCRPEDITTTYAKFTGAKVENICQQSSSPEEALQRINQYTEPNEEEEKEKDSIHK